MWRSEDNFVELVSSHFYMAFRIKLISIDLYNKYLTSHLIFAFKMWCAFFVRTQVEFAL